MAIFRGMGFATYIILSIYILAVVTPLAVPFLVEVALWENLFVAFGVPM